MPDEEKTVDIDTTGPGAEVDIEEKKEIENETIQDTTKPDDSPEKPSEQLDVQDSEPEKKEEVKEKQEEVKEKKETSDEKPKEELEQYSEGVQKRISKLTKKWREAERQKEAALDYAKGVQNEHTQLKTRISKLEPSYVTAIESKVASGLQAAQAKLARARDAGDIATEVEAHKNNARPPNVKKTRDAQKIT